LVELSLPELVLTATFIRLDARRPDLEGRQLTASWFESALWRATVSERLDEARTLPQI
jgi:hypothetical protein